MTSSWLTRALDLSRARGFLGPGPIETHITHAEGFAAVWATLSDSAPRRFLDLGSGGGVPGLVLGELWDTPGVLLDAMAKRVVFLSEVLEWDEAPQKLTPLVGRAEDLARENDLAETFDLVVARSFGPPAVLAECAARFLTVGGYLIVSEPPEPVEGRWNSSGLGQLGLELLESVRSGSHFQVLRKKRNTPDQYPRPVGVPGKKPLF